MIQEKYNKLIFDEATNDAIENYSHLRANVLSVVDFDKSDLVQIINPDSDAIVEWLQEQVDEVVAEESKKTGFNKVICLGKLSETPHMIKSKLACGGEFVFAFASAQYDKSFVKSLLTEAGFTQIDVFRVRPDYKFATEIFAEDYLETGEGDYLLIAR